MKTTADQMRAWRGPAVLTFGFRPFFLGGAIWAGLAMTLWVAMLAGVLDLPTAFDPTSWHAHEFLYGYLGAAAAGFLLTAVPNWTGQLPVVGWRLGGLAALWLLGRIVVTFGGGLPALIVALIDLSFYLALIAVLAREIIRGKNWRNLVVVLMLGVMTLGNALFHWDGAGAGYGAGGAGLRLGLGAGIMMIGVIGGRIVPSFTRNWLVRRGDGVLPVPPMQRFDKAALLMLAMALLAWVIVPKALPTGLGLLVVGVLHLIRLSRWAGHRTGAEPLVWVLHVGYLFVPLGALAVGVAVLWPGTSGTAAAQHLWMAGGVGLMTLAVMTRATLGHTGQPLTAGRGTVGIYLLLIAAVVLRVVAGGLPDIAGGLHTLAGLSWVAAFSTFVVIYGPLLMRPRRGRAV